MEMETNWESREFVCFDVDVGDVSERKGMCWMRCISMAVSALAKWDVERMQNII